MSAYNPDSLAPDTDDDEEDAAKKAAKILYDATVGDTPLTAEIQLE